MEERVSLTCEALVDNQKLWWITRESGRRPLCWWQPTEPADSSCGDNSVQHRSGACLIIKVALGVSDAVVTQRLEAVAIGKLEPHSLNISMRHIMRWLQRLPVAKDGCMKRGQATQEFFSCLNEGMFSLATGCACTGVAVCRECCRVHVNSRSFLVQGHYQCDHPLGRDHWFSGVTDAVGDVAHGQLVWLSCYCGENAPICTVS